MISQSTDDQVIATLHASDLRGAALRRRAMDLLAELPGYHWCGVYRLEGQSLLLDEFVGAPTDHTKIDVGVGVCGTAVAENRNQIVEDVRQRDNYLACSLQTRAEIVVLIRCGNEVLGQIDIDGHDVGAFDHHDEAFLARVAQILGDRWH